MDCFNNLQTTDVCLKCVKSNILGSGLIESGVLLCPNHLKITLSQIQRELISFNNNTFSKLQFFFKSSNSYGDEYCTQICFRSFSNFVLKWLENKVFFPPIKLLNLLCSLTGQVVVIRHYENQETGNRNYFRKGNLTLVISLVLDNLKRNS